MSFDTRPVWQIKKEICDIGMRIWQRGYCNGNEGNHSVRIAEDRVLCTPTNVSKGFLQPDDICVVDMDGNQVEPNPKGRKRTSEVKVHLAIYKHRPDVQAVIHSHPPHATAFAIAEIPLPEGIHPEAEVFLGKVHTARYATPSTQALPDSLIPLIGPQTNTLLMGNHGSVNFSFSLLDTYYKLEILDGYCKLLLLTRTLGKANVLDRQQMTELLEIKKKFGLPDDRLACAPEGCVGGDNESFLAGFEVRPMSAACSCQHGGDVDHSEDRRVTAEARANATMAASGNAAATPAPGDEKFEAMVRMITDQIMASMG